LLFFVGYFSFTKKEKVQKRQLQFFIFQKNWKIGGFLFTIFEIQYLGNMKSYRGQFWLIL